jgi:hypothetical protein
MCDNSPVLWLGDKRGNLSDWLTQQWVRATGRRIELVDNSWLVGPIGNARLIGQEFFADYAKEHSLEIAQAGPRGLIQDFRELCSEDPRAAAGVRDFYERTSEYELDVWSEWHGFFRPFGWALAALFSRRLQQLNVPLSSLDTSRGITSAVLQLRDPLSGKVVQTAWVRELVATRNTLYAGSYSVCKVPGYAKPCVKVVFPLPNGNAIVLMKPETHQDGSLSLTSAGERFGDPGFYFVVQQEHGRAWARYVPSLKETIRVYDSGPDTVRTDHVLRIWGIEFLRLHYRMRTAAKGKIAP